MMNAWERVAGNQIRLLENVKLKSIVIHFSYIPLYPRGKSNS